MKTSNFRLPLMTVLLVIITSHAMAVDYYWDTGNQGDSDWDINAHGGNLPEQSIF